MDKDDKYPADQLDDISFHMVNTKLNKGNSFHDQVKLLVACKWEQNQRAVLKRNKLTEPELKRIAKNEKKCDLEYCEITDLKEYVALRSDLINDVIDESKKRKVAITKKANQVIICSFLLSNNYLTNLPAEIVQLTYLRVLHAANNKLDCIPQFIAELIHLKELNFGKNCIKEIPHEIGHLTALESLILSHNEIGKTPKAIAQLAPTLVTLDLSNNALTEIAGLESLTNLRTLKISENRLMERHAEKMQKLSHIDYTIHCEWGGRIEIVTFP